jgi:hypothetical protein
MSFVQLKFYCYRAMHEARSSAQVQTIGEHYGKDKGIDFYIRLKQTHQSTSLSGFILPSATIYRRMAAFPPKLQYLAGVDLLSFFNEKIMRYWSKLEDFFAQEIQ